jgi:HTH-type transcriptional regulator, sugar sensing transcriptional regulator
MIVNNEFIKKIKDFGLNSYEAKLWTALLSRGISSAGELSDIANVPRSRTYDVLESLEKKGFIISKISKPLKYLALPPAEVLTRVKKKIELDSVAQLNNIEKLNKSDILDELNLLHTQGIDIVDTTEITGRFRGRDSLYDHIDMMIRAAEKEIIICTTEKGLLRKLDYFKKAFQKAAKKGVKIRIVAPVTKLNKDLVKELKDIAEVRHAKSLKGRFMVVDSESFMFMILDDEDVHPNYDLGIWVNTKFFSQALSSLFDLAWKEMKN